MQALIKQEEEQLRRQRYAQAAQVNQPGQGRQP
jgi:hypothetical protein